MKLRIGGKVYLQKYEFMHFMHKLNEIPDSIFQEVFNNNGGIFFINSPIDGFRFECVYQKPENVKWLMEQDWLVDYDEYTELSLAELETLQEHLRIKRIDDIAEFNAEDDAYREAHFDEESDRFDKLKHKISSLGYLIKFRKGEITFIFPDEYQSQTPTSGPVSTPRRKFDFFARLFGRSAQ